MGLRFRKSVKTGPLRINVSKSGVGWSVGGKGHRYTKKAGGGTRTTWSLPGTGLSYVTEKGEKKKKTAPVSPEIHVAAPSSVKPNSQPKASVKQRVQSSAIFKNPFENGQWKIKDNSIFDIFAKWIDRQFFKSEYSPTNEKLLLIAIFANIFGIHKIYAGRKISAVINFILLFGALIAKEYLWMFILPWLLVDLVRIFFGNYGRLKSNRPTDFNILKNLFANKSNGKVKAITGSVSAITALLILLFVPSAPSADTLIADNAASPTLAIVSQSDTELRTDITTSTSVMPAVTTLPETTTVTTLAPTTVTTTTKITTTKKPTTTTIKRTTTTKKRTTTTKKRTTTQPPNQANGDVWITASGSKYHRSSTCSNMKKPSKVALQYAKNHGYTPCKKCY